MNLTYLLGAGASANTFPTVQAFPEQIRACNNHFFTGEYAKYKSIKDCYEYLYREIIKYGTPDTAAKAMLFANKVDELERIRRSTSMFFTTYRSITSLISKEKIDRPNDQIDKRYFNLIASLGEVSEEQILPHEINVLTYNYDHLFEEALASMQVPEKGWYDQKISSWPRSSQINDHTTVIHLNGLAGFAHFSNGKDQRLVQKQSYTPRSSKQSIEILDAVKKILDDDSPRDRMNFSRHIRFAWEVAQDNNVVQKLQAIMQKTDLLVIVGYSFPYFNRNLDRKLFEGLMNPPCKEIAVVDPTFEVEHLKSLFRVDEKIHQKRLKTINEVDQFYIPPDYDIR